MNTDRMAELTQLFKGLITGVRVSQSLTQSQKDYILELLIDQLNVELQCLAEGVLPELTLKDL